MAILLSPRALIVSGLYLQHKRYGRKKLLRKNKNQDLPLSIPLFIKLIKISNHKSMSVLCHLPAC